MMHYFLGLEVRQYLDKIFLNQGKYVIEIIKRFGMIDFKALTTTMTTNLNLFNDDTSETIDTTLYRQIIASLKSEHATMYSTSTVLSAILDFFLLNHEIRLDPKLKQHPKCSFYLRHFLPNLNLQIHVIWSRHLMHIWDHNLKYP